MLAFFSKEDKFGYTPGGQGTFLPPPWISNRESHDGIPRKPPRDVFSSLATVHERELAPPYSSQRLLWGAALRSLIGAENRRSGPR
jgi:hypothetical protein